MSEPIIRRHGHGEYSTVELYDGTIETVYFWDNGFQEVVARTVPETVEEVAYRHFREHVGGY